MSLGVVVGEGTILTPPFSPRRSERRLSTGTKSEDVESRLARLQGHGAISYDDAGNSRGINDLGSFEMMSGDIFSEEQNAKTLRIIGKKTSAPRFSSIEGGNRSGAPTPATYGQMTTTSAVRPVGVTDRTAAGVTHTAAPRPSSHTSSLRLPLPGTEAAVALEPPPPEKARKSRSKKEEPAGTAAMAPPAGRSATLNSISIPKPSAVAVPPTAAPPLPPPPPAAPPARKARKISVVTQKYLEEMTQRNPTGNLVTPSMPAKNFAAFPETTSVAEPSPRPRTRSVARTEDTPKPADAATVEGGEGDDGEDDFESLLRANMDNWNEAALGDTAVGAEAAAPIGGVNEGDEPAQALPDTPDDGAAATRHSQHSPIQADATVPVRTPTDLPPAHTPDEPAVHSPGMLPHTPQDALPVDSTNNSVMSDVVESKPVKEVSAKDERRGGRDGKDTKDGKDDKKKEANGKDAKADPKRDTKEKDAPSSDRKKDDDRRSRRDDVKIEIPKSRNDRAPSPITSPRMSARNLAKSGGGNSTPRAANRSRSRERDDRGRGRDRSRDRDRDGRTPRAEAREPTSPRRSRREPSPVKRNSTGARGRSPERRRSRSPPPTSRDKEKDKGANKDAKDAKDNKGRDADRGKEKEKEKPSDKERDKGKERKDDRPADRGKEREKEKPKDDKGTKRARDDDDEESAAKRSKNNAGTAKPSATTAANSAEKSKSSEDRAKSSKPAASATAKKDAKAAKGDAMEGVTSTSTASAQGSVYDRARQRKKEASDMNASNPAESARLYFDACVLFTEAAFELEHKPNQPNAKASSRAMYSSTANLFHFTAGQLRRLQQDLAAGLCHECAAVLFSRCGRGKLTIVRNQHEFLKKSWNDLPEGGPTPSLIEKQKTYLNDMEDMLGMMRALNDAESCGRVPGALMTLAPIPLMEAARAEFDELFQA